MALVSQPQGTSTAGNGLKGAGGHGSNALNTLANQLTISRLFLSVVFFALLGSGNFTFLGVNNMLWSLAMFTVATATDALDGYLARRWGQVTALGRILDPFVDKIIICGAFIFLVAIKESRVSAWMVTLIVARELLVTAIRSFLERLGADFSATWSGKIKMIVQCIAVGWILLYLGLPGGLPRVGWPVWISDALIWGTLLSTVYSGGIYIVRAAALMRNDRSITTQS